MLHFTDRRLTFTWLPLPPQPRAWLPLALATAEDPASTRRPLGGTRNTNFPRHRIMAQRKSPTRPTLASDPASPGSHRQLGASTWPGYLLTSREPDTAPTGRAGACRAYTIRAPGDMFQACHTRAGIELYIIPLSRGSRTGARQAFAKTVADAPGPEAPSCLTNLRRAAPCPLTNLLSRQGPDRLLVTTRPHFGGLEFDLSRPAFPARAVHYIHREAREVICT